MIVRFKTVRVHLKSEEEEKQDELLGKSEEKDYVTFCAFDMSIIKGYSKGFTLLEGERVPCIYPFTCEGYELGNILVSVETFENILNYVSETKVIDYKDFIK